MRYYTAKELAEACHTTEKQITKDFPNTAVRQLKKGRLMGREKIEGVWKYTLEEVEPREADVSEFTIKTFNRGKTDKTSLPGEIWIDTYFSFDYEVSNLGRLRNKKTKMLHNGTINESGYHVVSVQKQNYQMHRIVLQSFSPNPDFENLTVDHINGKRSDNRLENLEWCTGEDNTLRMLLNRKDITIETTRLIQKYGYNKVLEILKNIG